MNKSLTSNNRLEIIHANNPGSFIGLSKNKIKLTNIDSTSLVYDQEKVSNIIISGKGISLSTNLISYCQDNGIAIDLFDFRGKHVGLFLSSKSMQNSCWKYQNNVDDLFKHQLCLDLITGKIKNQHYLTKYFHKYHKNRLPSLNVKLSKINERVKIFELWKKDSKILQSDKFLPTLRGHEAQISIYYWDYLRELLADKDIDFKTRQKKGASDLVNSMLNYGYSILQAKVIHALLGSKLNPYVELMHVSYSNNPVLVYDMMELFRSQAVDRVIFGLLQKGRKFETKDGYLDKDSRKIIIDSIHKRLNKYEYFRGTKITLNQIITFQSKELAKCFIENSRFKPYKAKW